MHIIIIVVITPIIREEIIDRLVSLQTGEEELKEVKTIDEYMWENLKNELEDEEELE